MAVRRLSKQDFDYVFARTPRLCVDLAVITKGGIVLTKRNIAPYKGLWHTPGGGVLRGEKLSETISRIAKEEIGVKVKVIRLLGAMEVPNDGKTGRHTISLFYEVEPESQDFKIDEQASGLQIFSTLPKNMITHHREFLAANLKLH